MSDFLSDEWISQVQDVAGDLPKVEGASLALDFEVSGAPAGKVRAHATIDEGQIVEVAPGANKQADCRVVVKAPIALDILKGELDPDVAFMRGDLKLEGAYERPLLELRPLWASEPWAALFDAIAKTL